MIPPFNIKVLERPPSMLITSWQPTPIHGWSRTMSRADRHIERRGVPPAHERLVDFVRHRVHDAARERRRCSTQEREPETDHGGAAHRGP